MENKIYLNQFFESTFMYFRKAFSSLNMRNLSIIIAKNEGFDIFLSYSYDEKNYSEFKEQEQYLDQVIDSDHELFVCVWFKRKINTDLSDASELYERKPSVDKYDGNRAYIENIDSTQQQIVVESISYLVSDPIDNFGVINFGPKDFSYKELFELINEFPKWNFYDNQEITIQRWLETCNSIAEMYGHTCIWFKTEPLVTTDKNPQSGIHGTHHTIANNVIRNVTSIKKLHILCPNNELPQDRNVFTEWDMPLQDDFLIHVVRQKFEQAFGLKSIPNEKDYIYFPIINKLFRVSTIQPKNGFMGVVGWYECYLAKYEEDDCVRVDSSLRDVMGGIPGISEGLDEFHQIPDDSIDTDFGEQDDLWQQLNEIKDDTILSEDKTNQSTVEEKKDATQNFTNKLEDTTFYVSLKETEKLRELYDKRLNIVSVNPDDSLYPITMYDCSSVEKRTVALQYTLKDYSVTNKFATKASSAYIVSFNYVLTGRHSAELFDIISEDVMVIASISIKDKKLIIFDTSSQETIVIEHQFIINEMYQVFIEYSVPYKQYSVKIFRLKDKQKTLDYQTINIINSYLVVVNISHLQLFGGNFLVNDICLILDSNKIIDDKCLPLLNMYKF